MVPFHLLGTQIFCLKLMGKKKQSSRGYSKRKQNTRQIRKRFLIICEGKETEPNYFRSFRVPGKVEVLVKGYGRDPNQLLIEAKKLLEKEKQAKKWQKGDQVWCVFDRDSWKEKEFNKAIIDTKEEGFNVAYSNEAFELWYILHFEYLNTPIPRKEYCKKLSKLLGHEYEKNSVNMYDKLFNKIETAIKHAEKLYAQYNHRNPAKENPSTTVYQLVKELKKNE